MSLDTAETLPLWLLYDDEIDAWRQAQPALVATWLSEHHFKAERHRVLAVPDARGALQMVVGGLGKRQGALSLWHGAGFVERLPPRHYRLAQTFSIGEATQLHLGFLYGSYRFERYRPLKLERAATVEAPPNSDSRFVASAAESLTLARDWKALEGAGYRAAEVTLVDLFPQTFHMETVVVFRGGL